MIHNSHIQKSNDALILFIPIFDSRLRRLKKSLNNNKNLFHNYCEGTNYETTIYVLIKLT